nr:hypothetical protein [Acidimicrobiia bacterium]
MQDTRAFEDAVWADVEGYSTAEELATLEADERRWARVLDRLIGDLEANLAEVRRLPGEERDQVVADFEAELAGLEAAFRRATHAPEP